MSDLGFDEFDATLQALDGLVVADRERLTEAQAPRGPAVYAIWAPKVPPYRHADLRSGRVAVYVGSAISGRERLGRHRNNARGVSDLDDGNRLWIAFIPLSSYPVALFAESALIALTCPLWCQPWLRGFGSRWQGSTRVTQRTAPWAVLHRGRRVCAGATNVTTERLRQRAEDHLAQTAVALWPPLV